MLLDFRYPPHTPSYATAFAPALMDPNCATPTEVVGPRGKAAVKRYNVYRNNVTVSLIDALAAIYPAVQRITGADFFRAMARFHVRATPPTSPLLFEYGRDFPAFVEEYEYAKNMPWLSDVARLERAWLDAYHAADVVPLSWEIFASVPSEELGRLSFTAHPAARIVRSRFPAVGIFVMNRTDEVVSSFRSNEAEDALVTRPEHEVLVRKLPTGAASFLGSLLRGDCLEGAATIAFAEAPSFDLGANLAGMIEAGVFSAFSVGA